MIDSLANFGFDFLFHLLNHRKLRSSHPEVFLRKGVLKKCSKFTAEHPCRSAISIKLLCNGTSKWFITSFESALILIILFKSIGPTCSVKKVYACNFIKKETLAQVFSCVFCDISENTFSNRTPLVAAFCSYYYCISLAFL